MVDVLIFGTFGGIIGARLFYVIFEWEQYKDHLLDIFKIWEGGMRSMAASSAACWRLGRYAISTS